MPIQFDTTVQNAILEAVSTTVGPSPKIQFFDGVVPGYTAAPPNGNKVAEFPLSSSWTVAASNGSKSLSGLPVNVTGISSGTVRYFRIVDALGVCRVQGTVTGSGGGGDFELDNPNVTVGQNVVLNAWAFTAPGS